MNWITNIVRPRIKGLMGNKDRGGGDTPENLWVKCPDSGELVFDWVDDKGVTGSERAKLTVTG